MSPTTPHDDLPRDHDRDEAEKEVRDEPTAQGEGPNGPAHAGSVAPGAAHPTNAGTPHDDLLERLTDEERALLETATKMVPKSNVLVDELEHLGLHRWEANHIVAAANAIPHLINTIARLRKIEQAADGLVAWMGNAFIGGTPRALIDAYQAAKEGR